MFAIRISEKGGESRRVEFDKAEITIGRVQGNDIVLPKGNVSKRHSRIVLKDGKFIVVDLKSTNGTYVNGRKIASPIVVKASDKVYIGDFVISVEEHVAEPAGDVPSSLPRRPSSVPPPPPPSRRTGPNQPTSALQAADGSVDGLPPPPPPPPPDMLAGADSPDDLGLGLGEDEPVPLRMPEPPRPTRPMGAAMPAPLHAPVSASQRPVPGRRPTVMGDPVAERISAHRSGPPSAGSVRPSAPVLPVNPAPSHSTSPSTASQPSSRDRMPVAGTGGRRDSSGSGLAPSSSSSDHAVDAAFSTSERVAAAEALRSVAARLADQLGPDALGHPLADSRVWERAQRLAADAAGELAPSGLTADAVAHDAVAEVLGTGPLEALLADPSVIEIRVPRFDRILVERDGERTVSDRFFSSPEALARAVRRLAVGAQAQGGIVEARLPDGHLMVALLPPLVPQVALTIRRPRRGVTLEQLVDADVLPQKFADLLALAVRARRSIVIAGATSGGRAQVLAALQHELEATEAVVIVGDGALLDTPSAAVGVVPAGGPERALVAALRLGPDRLVICEDAAGAVVAALAARPGTIAAVAAVSGPDAVGRLIALARLQGQDGDSVRDTITQELHLVLTVGRGHDGRVRATHLAELERLDARGRATLVDILVVRGDGTVAATGHVPVFAEGAAPALFKN